jgi:hypothetical protein
MLFRTQNQLTCAFGALTFAGMSFAAVLFPLF